MSEILKRGGELLIPSRSKFQLKHFVIGQHPTPAMKWKQLVIEAQVLFDNIKIAEIELQIRRKKIEKLKTGDEVAQLKAKKLEIQMQGYERLIEASKIEFSYLEEIAQGMPSFSLQDIEENQKEYWSLRLKIQSDVDTVASQSGISAGNVTSMLNAGLIEWSPKEINAISNL